MRVYGTSPLYNFVELVFRAKRLYITSICLASLTMVGVWAMHKKTYTANMIVVLTGSEIVNPKDDKEKGTVEYKISLLNVLLRDPNFVKGAMHAGNLDVGKSDLEFAAFCKEVTTSLSYSSDKSNILQITCSWPDKDICEKILKSLYSAYSRSVIDQETLGSTTRTSMLNVLLKDYTAKYDELNQKVKDYQLKHAGQPMDDFIHANEEYRSRKQTVATIQDNLNAAQRQLASIEDKLRNTPQTIQETVTYIGNADSAERKQLLEKRDIAKKEYEELLSRYQPENPKVKDAKANYEAVLAEMKRLDAEAVAKAKQKPDPKNIASSKQAINPAYQSLDAQRIEQQLAITRIESELTNAKNQLAEADKRLHIAPIEQIGFQKMTADMGLYTKVHDDLRAELETARLNEMRDKEMKTKEMTVLVQPEAEPEKNSARAVLTLAAGPILGIIIAFCFSLLGEAMDHSLRSPMEIEKFLDKPVLAVLPRMDTKTTNQPQLDSGEKDRPSLPS